MGSGIFEDVGESWFSDISQNPLGSHSGELMLFGWAQSLSGGAVVERAAMLEKPEVWAWCNLGSVANVSCCVLMVIMGWKVAVVEGGLSHLSSFFLT